MLTLTLIIFIALGAVLMLVMAAWLLGVRYIPHTKVGIVEKLWSFKGSLEHGRIIATEGRAGFQADILRGGAHHFLFPWQYRIHREPLVTIGEGKIGYLYARDGRPLAPKQTLGAVVACNNFQDTAAFLGNGGQRGRQRDILREGVYAVNLAQFVVITEDRIYAGPIPRSEREAYDRWQRELRGKDGFSPVVIGRGVAASDVRVCDTDAEGDQVQTVANDSIGIVTVHDGPPIPTGEIIAPEISGGDDGKGHDYFQDPEAFLALGGHRGKQLQVLTDGTFFINRWFATIEMRSKTTIPIGYVGVVVSYHGVSGEDVTGDLFRYGEQVEHGHRGVWKRALPPGKYALNPFALKVELVPTINFVLRWITGQSEAHTYDKDLRSIELITADGYEPLLPLSLVLHIDYQKAPRVVQRFGDVRRLISQTLDPLLSAYFRNVAQHCNMLDLLTKREEIQVRATEELQRRFQEYDISCIAVMIGRPESAGDQYQPGQDPIERLFDQLRKRRLAEEQISTYGKQEDAARKLRELNQAEAEARKQAELAESEIDIRVTANRSEARLAEARRLAKRDVALAAGEARSIELKGRAEAERTSVTGMAAAAVARKKVLAFGDPRIFALQRVTQALANSRQPLVPERLMVNGTAGSVAGPAGGASGMGPLVQLLTMLLAEKAGIDLVGPGSEAAADAGDDHQTEDDSQGAAEPLTRLTDEELDQQLEALDAATELDPDLQQEPAA